MATEYTENLNQILKDTLPELPGVVRSAAARELRLAMREFFERSFAWTKVVTGVAISAGDTAIQIDDGDTNTEVVGILAVRVGNDTDGYRPLPALGAEPDKIEGAESASAWYVTSNPDELKLTPYYNTAPTDTLRVTVALMPAFDVSVTDDELPRQITLKYYDAIRNGFLARMYMQPGKPYSQPVLATQLRQNFLQQIGFYAAQRKKGYNNSPNWTYPSSGWSPRRRLTSV